MGYVVISSIGICESRYNRFSIKLYRFCIGICCGIGVADLCWLKMG